MPTKPTTTVHATHAPASFFVLRTPLLPASVLDDLGKAASVDAAADARSTSATTELLARLGARPEIAEALFLASPTLAESLDRWRANPNASGAARSVESLLKYVLRMASRCTPFGLFSGCTFGSLADETRLTLEPTSRYRRHARLDMGYLAALGRELLAKGELRGAVKFEPSSTAYRSGTSVRYAESRQRDGGRRENCIVEVDDSPGLTAALEAAAGGAVRDVIAAAVASAEDVSLDEARSFVDALVDNQLLVSELEPLLTGAAADRAMLETLARVAPAHPATSGLSAAVALFDALDSAPLGAPPSRYLDLASRLAPLPADADPNRLFHVDLVKPAAEATLGERVVARLASAIDLLARITASGESPDLAAFRDAFVTRWESAAVPLALVLDEERGIGFGNGNLTSDATPLLESIVFPAHATTRVPFGARDAWLVHRASAFSAATTRAWELTESDIATLEVAERLPLPDAFGAMFSIVRAPERTVGRPAASDVEERELLVFHGTSGPSGANMMGRFCHGSPELRDAVRAHLAAEEALAPDVVFAELVHLPEGRTGNILGRPLLRRYEIPYLARSGAGPSQRLELDDLAVTVRNGRIVLLSRRLGKEVRPRLTTAHNHAATELPIYRFLNALAQAGCRSSLGWDWGLASSAAFLPRVTHRGVVLSPATWNVSRARLVALEKADERTSSIAELARELGLPRWVNIVDGDHVLPIDLESALAVDILAASTKGRDMALTEVLSPSAQCVVSSSDGVFTSELLLPFVARASQARSTAIGSARSTVPRRFPPGSEWLYVKLYCGTSSVDTVMTELGPCLRGLVDEGIVDRWFFVRYGDPGWHVRVRLHGEPERLGTHARRWLDAIAAKLVDDGLVWRVQYDTYEREIERYGGDAGIEIAEKIFHADSELALDLLAQLTRDDASERRRWLFALAGIDRLLVCFAKSLVERHAIAAANAASFAHEQGVHRGTERSFGRLFRKERADIADALHRRPIETFPPAITAAFDRREARIAPLAASLLDLERGGELDDLPRLVDSALHMFANRILKSEHRRQECVLHDLLERAYDSELARVRPRAERSKSDAGR